MGFQKEENFPMKQIYNVLLEFIEETNLKKKRFCYTL